MRTGVTNLGVTAALVLSVTLSLIIEPPQPTDDESAFEEVHKDMQQSTVETPTTHHRPKQSEHFFLVGFA
eukprot:702361-Amphidinium_carterae.1